jgi:hypothetical protein
MVRQKVTTKTGKRDLDLSSINSDLRGEVKHRNKIEVSLKLPITVLTTRVFPFLYSL